MDFDVFKKAVMDEMRERFPNLEFGSREMKKLQGESYEGLMVTIPGSKVSASLNLDSYYERTNTGASEHQVMDLIESAVREASQNMPQLDWKVLGNYEQMKETLMLQMIPVKGNEEKLAEIPHETVEDMAVVYRFDLGSNERGTSSVLVTDTMLKSYGITRERLAADAIDAAVKNHPASLRNMNEVLQEMAGDRADDYRSDEPSPVWVATVEGGMNGASVIQYPGFLDRAVEAIGGDFYVLPSSIHEVLLVADDGSVALKQLEQMVRDINEAEVAPADRLSDNVFHYDSEAHLFENARSFELREAMLAETLFSEDEPEQPKSLTVLLVEPNRYPKVVEIGSDLSNLQKAVGGYIEVVYPFEEKVGLIVNEEGKMNGLPLNRALRDENGEVYDVVAGSVLVTGLTEESFASLTQAQINKFEKLFHQPEAFLRMGNRIMALPIPKQEQEAKRTAKTRDTDTVGSKSKPRKTGHDER